MTSAVPSATDMTHLRSLNVGQDEITPEVLREVSKQFEALFTQEMLKSMRKANAAFESSLEKSSAKDMYQDLHDEQLSLSLSSEGEGIGLADVIYRQLSGIHSIKRTDYPQMGDDKPLDISSPQAFVKSIYPSVKAFAEKKGFDPRILLAQTALETGWGKSLDQGKTDLTHNLFGIKDKSNWQGDVFTKKTTEYAQGQRETIRADFRRYDSVAESLEDYWQFLQQPHYQQAVEQRQNPNQYFTALQKAGYATDPHYADKLDRIYNSNPLRSVLASLEE